jgi:hypothetical protein
MPTHSQLAAQLLRDAAAFFETIGEQNEPLKAQMMENAAVFREVGHLVETNPTGELQGHIHDNHDHHHEGGCCGGSHHHHDEAEDEAGSSDSKGGCCH